MSTVNAVSASSAPYTPTSATKPKQNPPAGAAAPPVSDADHDGDTDGKGLDVKG